MNKVTIPILCALIVPIALAQTDTAKDASAIATKTKASSTRGTVSEFSQGKSITVTTKKGDSISHVLTGNVRFVDKNDETIEFPAIKPGTKVKVFYDVKDGEKIASRVILDVD